MVAYRILSFCLLWFVCVCSLLAGAWWSAARSSTHWRRSPSNKRRFSDTRANCDTGRCRRCRCALIAAATVRFLLHLYLFLFCSCFYSLVLCCSPILILCILIYLSKTVRASKRTRHQRRTRAGCRLTSCTCGMFWHHSRMYAFLSYLFPLALRSPTIIFCVVVSFCP